MHPYLPHTEEDIAFMLDKIGVYSLEELFSDIPKELRLNRALNIEAGYSEHEIRRDMETVAKLNTSTKDYVSFLGGGAYQHYVPAVIKHLISRQEFFTAYTPYQPEISQGTLQAIFEYQSMICELTGMDVSNASLYDGGTALAEATFLANHGNNKQDILLSATVNPQYREVVKTYARFNGLNVIDVNEKDGVTDLHDLENKLSDESCCVLVQIPNYYGVVENGMKIKATMEKTKALLIVSSNPISLGLLEAPRNYGADVVVGEGQSLGSSIQFGGPYLGFIATTKEHMRRMPGRIVGQTKDINGKRAFVLTLQAREQHIRREKAMSNITSNQGLVALMATIYLSVMGKMGICEVASHSLYKAHYLSEKLSVINGIDLKYNRSFFNEFVITTKPEAQYLVDKLEQKGYFAGLVIGSHELLVCVTEIHSKEVLDAFIHEVEVACNGL